MSTLTMNWTQQSAASCKARSAPCRAAPPVWEVAAGQPRRLAPARATRWLRLRAGQAWITTDGRPGGPVPEDWWLAVGEAVRLPPGTPVLIEGWPSASFELLEEPGA